MLQRISLNVIIGQNINIVKYLHKRKSRLNRGSVHQNKKKSYIRSEVQQWWSSSSICTGQESGVLSKSDTLWLFRPNERILKNRSFEDTFRFNLTLSDQMLWSKSLHH